MDGNDLAGGGVVSVYSENTMCNLDTIPHVFTKTMESEERSVLILKNQFR